MLRINTRKLNKKFNVLSVLLLHVPLNFKNTVLKFYIVFPTKILTLNILYSELPLPSFIQYTGYGTQYIC